MRGTFLLICALILLVLRHPAVGQEIVRFDTVHLNQVGSFAVGYGVYETDSVYRVFSLQKGLDQQSQDIFVTDFDFHGGLTSERTFQSSKQDFFGYTSGMVPASTGYYAGVVRFGSPDVVDSLFMYRFGADGDTMWTRFVAVDTTWTYRNLSLTTAGDLLLTGTHYPPNEAYVYRLDTAAAIQSYHGYDGFYGEDVVEGRDGSWYVCGRGNIGASNGYPILIRSDTLGNESWRRSDNLYGNYFSLIPSLDSGIVALGYRADGFVAGPRAKIIKYDRYGAEQWMRELYQSSFDEWPCRLYTGFQEADSSFIVAGAVRDTVQGYAGMLFRLDKEGNTIWQRFYTRFQGFALNHDQVFWDVKRTSDGGLILTGETNTDDYPYARLWLLKLDSMGCLVPGCGSVGVEEYTDRYNGKLLVSPNPSRERVQVSLLLSEGHSGSGALRVLLMDAQGRIVSEQAARKAIDQVNCTLDVSNLEAGSYYVHLADQKTWLAGGKLIVQ